MLREKHGGEKREACKGGNSRRRATGKSARDSVGSALRSAPRQLCAGVILSEQWTLVADDLDKEGGAD